MHMKRTADRLFGDEYHWSVLGAGRNQMPIAAQSLAMGGNVRVGLEDSLWIGPGQLAKSNAEQVHQGAPDHRRPRAGGRQAPTRRARCCSSRAATRWRSEACIRGALGPDTWSRLQLLGPGYALRAFPG